MASVLGLERSQTSTADAYDHAINLVDSTRKPQNGVGEDREATSDFILSPVDSSQGENSKVTRQWTRTHLRQEIARRKYNKYQEGTEDTPRTSLQSNGENAEDADKSNKPAKQGTFGTQGRLRDKIPLRLSTKKQKKVAPEDSTFIDVLYENQRGSFFCGIPLYSANSLLNFDPSGWQTANFQDSPVDTTNAQVPDPSWAWEWRSWYVDMSHDVDEEGWEYSFSFSPQFAWHGNHPWFHSFCRRRRWLRKRVKRHLLEGTKESKNEKDGHRLTADYFTIHNNTAMDRSRSTSGDRSATRRSSTLAGYQTADDDDEEDVAEITNISILMTAIKRARVDREKVRAVNQFLKQGGDELFYLADSISLILGDLIHRESRRQLQTGLLKALDEAIDAKDASEKSESDSEKQAEKERRVDNILKAIKAGGVHVDDQDYWRKLKARADGQEEGQTSVAEATNESSVDFNRDEIAKHIHDEGGLGDEMKGISKDAEISVEPGIRRPNTETEVEDTSDHSDGKVLDKGKGKEGEA